jgi:hypothetical protein
MGQCILGARELAELADDLLVLRSSHRCSAHLTTRTTRMWVQLVHQEILEAPQ